MSSKRDARQLWWLVHGEKLGLLLGVIVATAFFAMTASYLLDIGPKTKAYGKITGFRVTTSDSGADVDALVTVADRSVRVTLRPNHNCEFGERIELARRKTMWGEFYSSALVPCP